MSIVKQAIKDRVSKQKPDPKVAGRFGRSRIGSAKALKEAKLISNRTCVILSLMEKLHRQSWTTQALTDSSLAKYAGVSKNVVRKLRLKLEDSDLFRVAPHWNKDEPQKITAHQKYKYTFLSIEEEDDLVVIETDFKVVEEEEIIDEVEEIVVPTRPDIMPTRPDIMPKRPDIGPKRPNEVPSNPDPARDGAKPLDLFLDASLDSPLDGPGGGGEIQVNQQEETSIAVAPTDHSFSLEVEVAQSWSESKISRSISVDDVRALIEFVESQLKRAKKKMTEIEIYDRLNALFGSDDEGNYMSFYFKTPTGKNLLLSALGLDNDSLDADAVKESNRKARADHQKLKQQNEKLKKPADMVVPDLDELMGRARGKNERPGARKAQQRLAEIKAETVEHQDVAMLPAPGRNETVVSEEEYRTELTQEDDSRAETVTLQSMFADFEKRRADQDQIQRGGKE
tara:strand:+ start:606 stop:1967 length:1362 start_codon:yes stop_codon:yes gene_type:complete